MDYRVVRLGRCVQRGQILRVDLYTTSFGGPLAYLEACPAEF